MGVYGVDSRSVDFITYVRLLASGEIELGTRYKLKIKLVMKDL